MLTCKDILTPYEQSHEVTVTAVLQTHAQQLERIGRLQGPLSLDCQCSSMPPSSGRAKGSHVEHQAAKQKLSRQPDHPRSTLKRIVGPGHSAEYNLQYQRMVRRPAIASPVRIWLHAMSGFAPISLLTTRTIVICHNHCRHVPILSSYVYRSFAR